MLYELQQATEKVGLKINYNKTKMIINIVPREKIIIEDIAIEMIEKYMNILAMK